MKERDQGKVTLIFDATLDLVAEVGLTGLKMADIARRAQLASGTLYLYFASKEELLNALYRTLKLRYTQLSDGDDAEGRPLKLRLRRLWEHSLQYSLEHFRESVFLEQFAYSPYISQESRDVSQQFTRYLGELLEQGKRETLIKPVDNALLWCLIAGFMKETVAMCKQQGLKLTPQLLEDSFALCWDALKA